MRFDNELGKTRWFGAFSAALLALILALSWSVAGQIAVRNQGFVPFSDAPIFYRGEVRDPVAELQRQLDAGRTTLEYEPVNGYLKSVLDHLRVPVSSQTLVFSKTSFQYRKISPTTPRALYFNDDVYVGKVHEGKAIEIVSFDPRQGAIFYLLDEQPVERPVFQRAELDCTTCHVAATTRNVPGVLVRSVYATVTGTLADRTPTYVSGNQSPLAERFGGWYVTGRTGLQTHMGNAVVTDTLNPLAIDRAAGANVTDLSSRFDTSRYLSPHSDIVAQLVQAHQTQMHNLITLTSYQTRIALYEREQAAAGEGAAAAPAASRQDLDAATRGKIERPAEELVRYLLFADEAPLDGPIVGSSSFAEDFSARGPRDRRGRSLRDFDLRTRLFKHPLSYLIYTEAFDALPAEAKGYVYGRLHEILSSRAGSDEFWTLSDADRRAIYEILVDTKPGLPADWKKDSHRKSTTGGK